MQSDYDINDEEDLRYIQNRPFYDSRKFEDIIGTEILDTATNDALTSNGVSIIKVASLPDTPKAIVDEIEYIQGVSSTYTTYSDIGNASCDFGGAWLIDESDTSLRIETARCGITIFYLPGFYVLKPDSVELGECKIKTKGEIKYIDNKFIEDSSIAPEKLSQNYATEKYVDDKIDNIEADFEVADNTVTESKLVNNAVTTNKLNNGAVTPEKLDRTYLTEHQSLDGYATEDYVDEVVGGLALGTVPDGSITPEKLDRAYTEQSEFETVRNGLIQFINTSNYKHQRYEGDILALKFNKIENPILSPTLDDVGKVLQLKLEGNKGAVWSAEFIEGAGGVADGSVTTDKLADGSVTTRKLSDKIKQDISTALSDSSSAKETADGVKTDFDNFYEGEWQPVYGSDGMYWYDISINDESSSLNGKFVNEACVELENRIGDINAVLDAINGEVI